MFKNKLFIFASLIACLALTTGCKEDEENKVPERVYIPLEGTLLDGGKIDDLRLYCIEKHGEHGLSEYLPKIKTVPDYNSFWLQLNLYDAGSHPSLNEQNLIEQSEISKIVTAYNKEKSLFIWESYHSYLQHAITGWPILYTAYIDGEVTITCDKTLFGEEPGTNLSSYLTVKTAQCPCIPIGIENPTFLYNYGEEAPTKASELFADGAWLLREYFLEFAEQPSEKYEELTFSVSLPMIREHVRDYAEAKYKGEDPKPIFTESTFEAKCMIKFDWK